MSSKNRIMDQALIDALETDIVIPVMGTTGAGKSSFINSYLAAIGEEPRVEVGENLVSCTVQLKSIIVPNQIDRNFSYLPPETRVVIVDTPGFDDTIASDFEILKRIANWLQES